MEASNLLTAFSGNAVAMILALSCYIAYKRCLGCRSHIHTSWIDCESDRLTEQKTLQKISIIKRALTEHKTESQRGVL